MAFTKQQIATAIDAEAQGWAVFFGVADQGQGIAARKLVMQANVSAGYLDPLLPYLPKAKPVIKIEKMAKAQASGDWHDRPLRWAVVGPATEVQKFPTWKEARKYAVIRRAAPDERTAHNRYADYVEV